MLSQFNREAHGFSTSASSVAPRSCFRLFALAPIALLLAICLPAVARAQNQDPPDAPQTSSSSSSQTSSSSSSQTAQQNRASRRTFESRRQLTKQRREAEAVTETYTHRWEAYTGGSYLRFRPGPDLHNSGVAGWTLGLTRYFNPRFGITADARGDYGTNSLGPVVGGGNNTFNASFSVFQFTIGPQYRFYGTAKWSVSAAAQVGAVYGYFDANTNGFPAQDVGFYPASTVAGGIVSLNIDYNLSPGLALRIAPLALFDNFGGNVDHNQGFLVGVVYRFGRQ